MPQDILTQTSLPFAHPPFNDRDRSRGGLRPSLTAPPLRDAPTMRQNHNDPTTTNPGPGVQAGGLSERRRWNRDDHRWYDPPVAKAATAIGTDI